MDRQVANMHAMTGAAVVALLLLPPVAFAQSGSPRGVPSRGAERAGPVAGMKRTAYIDAAQTRAGQAAAKRFERIGGGKSTIDRDTYVHYYEARSAQLAGTRFDRIDTDRNGVLEPAEIAAWRADHRRAARAGPGARPANMAAH